MTGDREHIDWPGPGPEADAIVAEKVMGFDLELNPAGGVLVDAYTDSIGNAWNVVKEMRGFDYYLTLQEQDTADGRTLWRASFLWIWNGKRPQSLPDWEATGAGDSASPEEAICIAALRAKGFEVTAT